MKNYNYWINHYGEKWHKRIDFDFKPSSFFIEFYIRFTEPVFHYFGLHFHFHFLIAGIRLSFFPKIGRSFDNTELRGVTSNIKR